jgi:multidrug resistance protein, MATE family
MNTREQREKLRWKHKPFPELVRLAWPIAVSMLSYSVMTLVDTLFAGRLGATALGAVGFGGVVTFTMLCFGIGLLRAAKVLIAQAVGAERRDRIGAYVGAALLLAVAVGGSTALFGQIVAHLLPRLVDGSAAVRLAQRYVQIRILGAPMILTAFAIREVRCALGDSRSPMRTALIANAAHIPLNGTLIFTAGLGVTGAAISTVIAQGFEAAMLLWIQRRDGLGLRAFARRDVLDVWNTGLPMGLEMLFNVGSFSVLVTLVARVSDVDLAAHQVANQATMFAILPMVAVGEAAGVLAGQAVGANEDGLVRRVARIAVLTGSAYGLFCSAVYVFFGARIAGALTHDAQVSAIAVRLLWIAASWQCFGTLYAVGASVLRGTGDVRFATIAMVTIAWVVTPPFAVLLGIHLGLGAVGGWLALLGEWAVGGAVLYLRVERSGWLPAAARSRERLASAPGDVFIVEPAKA